MPSFAYIKLSDKLACQSGITIFGVLRPDDLVAASDVMAIDEPEALRFSYPRVDRFGEARAITAHMRAGRVLTVVWEDGSTDEWRVRSVTTGRGMGGLIEVEGVSILLDLAERADSAGGKGWVSELSAGERIFDYEIAERTASSILASYVIPNGPSYITLGVVDPWEVIPALSVNRLTPLALAYAVRDSLRGMDVSCELRLRRNTQNRLLQTEAFDQSPWSGNASVTPNTTQAPDGTVTADTLAVVSNPNNDYRYQDFTSTASESKTLSLHITQGTGTTIHLAITDVATTRFRAFNVVWTGGVPVLSVQGGTLGGTASVHPVEGPDAFGFYHVAVTVSGVLNVNPSRVEIYPSFSGANGETNIVWGVQLTNGDVPLPYTKNVASITDGYQLDLVTQVGSTAKVPVFHPTVSLLSLKQKTDPSLQATRILVQGGTAPDSYPGVLGRARWRGGAPSGLVIALTDRNGGSSPIAFDDQWVDAYLLRVKTGRTFSITDSDAAAGTVTLSGVSTIAADEDFEFRLTEPLTNTRTTTTRYAISAVGGSTITCGVSVPITADDQYVDWYAKVWSLSIGGTVILTTRISDTVASTDVLTVASTTGVTTSHFVEFVQLDGAGEVPAYVDHPLYSQVDPVGYGIKAGELSRAGNLGITQLVPNSWMRTWSNGSNPPDGYSKVGTVTTSRESSASFTRYGGYSWKFVYAGDGGGGNFQLWSPFAYPNWDAGHVRVSCRCWVYFSVYGSAGSSLSDGSSSLTVYALTPTGALGASLGSVTITPTNTTNYTGTKVSEGSWLELKVEGITLAPTTAPYGVVGVFRPNVLDNSPIGSPNFTGYLDTIEFYPFLMCPSASYEHGDATVLLQSGNRKLDELATPPVQYDITVRDLERAFPVEYSRLATTVGGDIRAVDSEYGTDVTIRLLRRTRDLKKPTATSFVLANRPTRLTSLIQTGISKPKVDPTVAFVSSGSAAAVLTPPVSVSPQLTIFAAASTIPAGYGTSTPSTAPVLTVEPGGTVTYVPSAPTSPTTTVAPGVAGVSPRPRPRVLT